jgi:hypothetical protein
LKLSADPEYRLLQIFLGKSAEQAQVFEVYMHLPSDRLVCSCPGYRLRRECKHATWVSDQVDLHGGYIAAIMREDASLTQELMQDPAAFRRWLYDNGRVLMLE